MSVVQCQSSVHLVLVRFTSVRASVGADKGKRLGRFTSDRTGRILVTKGVQLESSVHLVLVRFTSV